VTLIPVPQPPGERPAAQDFYLLRREGIGHIQQAGSDNWTDYNTHDPGISILESLAYAITDLAYRTGFPIEDILASSGSSAPGADPYPDQTFYSARHVLTVNPTTAEDFRRLLIDVNQVRNAWVRCKACACDTPLFAWCEDKQLVLSDDPSQRNDPKPTVQRITPRGLYDVLLELEAAPGLGDLNDRKIVRRRSVEVDGQFRPLTIEVRFPAWPLARPDERQALAADDQAFQLTVAGPNNTTAGVTPVTDEELRRHWFDVLYVDFAIGLADGTTIAIENASVRLFGDSSVRGLATVVSVLDWLGDATPEGFVEPYRRKLSLTDSAFHAARAVLEAHRNLDEDYCHLSLVEIDDIAVCADVEVEPTADIELVQARIWFEIERYLDPPVNFWSLEELLARGEPVEAIFNGPELDNGFLSADGLAASDLRSELRVSDLIDRLSDIEGVVSIANLLLTAYDASGNLIKGIADPTWHNGAPEFDPDRTSAAWLLYPRPDHRTRLHHALSRFQFTSRGLPFLPRLDEAESTLVQLHGRAARPKLHATDLDLPVPLGTSRQLEAYHPIQHSFPLTYGIGPAGLPSTATPQRRAQARQLKGYLMVYEQLLRNGYAQLAHVGDLFSLDPAIGETYFSGLFGDAPIAGYDDLVDAALDAAGLQHLIETSTEFLERRNRFLDHLLARFGEGFGDYAMALTDLEGQGRARTELIHDKITFLRALPRISHDRGKALNRAVSPCDPDNASGLQQRVNLLLGLPDWVLAYRARRSATAPGFTHSLSAEELGRPIATFVVPLAVGTALAALVAARQLDTTVTDWQLLSTDGRLVLTTETASGTSTEVLPGSDGEGATLRRELDAAQRSLLAQLIVRGRYTPAPSGARWVLAIVDGDGNPLGETVVTFPTQRLANDDIAVIATWAAHKRAIVVEHLLLRPKFPGDALILPCPDESGCEDCGPGADPYSFRLTYVMPGWTAPFSTNLTMRAYADRTIQEQTPCHLLGKTCWVGNDGYLTDPCDPMVDRLAAALAGAVENTKDACTCAAGIYQAYGSSFREWFEAHTIIHDSPGVLADTLDAMFDADVDLSLVSCSGVIDADLRSQLQVQLVEHFVGIARHGYQFERFEDAWCAWADAEAAMDWTQEQLQETVVELLRAGATSAAGHPVLCRCAATVLATFGTAFREWMDTNIAAGRPLDGFTDFNPPTLALCPDIAFAPGAAEAIAEAIRELLRQRYATYTEVSYRLNILVRRLDELRNTYPRATLHDCDAGSDFNPVRLGQTALGST
jgi:hypothetical protein